MMAGHDSPISGERGLPSARGDAQHRHRDQNQPHADKLGRDQAFIEHHDPEQRRRDRLAHGHDGRHGRCGMIRYDSV